ncbi:hypothetical protein TKK_0005448 [Trichogramma kaykai]|uniref:Uncharacterized protein n=1 Tax=Trichogramma kaykai TaxID=54128 RepID=A0ABD2XGT1_9HYME
MAKQAWKKITSTTISNCFRKAGFINESASFNSDIPTTLKVPEFYSLLEKSIPFEKYIACDDNVYICGEVSDTDILQEVAAGPESESSSEDEVATADPPCTHSQAHVYMTKLIKYFESQSETEEILSNFSDAGDFIVQKKISSIKQSTLDSYFKKEIKNIFLSISFIFI